MSAGRGTTVIIYEGFFVMLSHSARGLDMFAVLFGTTKAAIVPIMPAYLRMLSPFVVGINRSNHASMTADAPSPLSKASADRTMIVLDLK